MSNPGEDRCKHIMWNSNAKYLSRAVNILWNWVGRWNGGKEWENVSNYVVSNYRLNGEVEQHILV